MVVSPIESRYKTEMNALFEEQARIDAWMEVEVALARAHAKLGNMPSAAAEEIAAAVQRVESVLRRRPEAGIQDDAPASARWDGGLKIAVSPDGLTLLRTNSIDIPISSLARTVAARHPCSRFSTQR